MLTRGDRHLHAMQQAKQLAALGARLKTIHVMTGMPPRQVQSFSSPTHTRFPVVEPRTRPSGTTVPTSFCAPMPASLVPSSTNCAAMDSPPWKP